MKYIVNPKDMFVIGYCVACGGNCDNRCQDQCIVVSPQ